MAKHDDVIEKGYGPPEPAQQSFSVASWAKRARWPGQVPGNALLELRRLSETPPQHMTVELLTAHTGPVLSPSRIVQNLGMSPQQEMQWARFLETAAETAPNEVILRQSLFQKMQNDRLEPELRNAIFQRAMNYARNTMRKSVQVFTPDELRKAEPAVEPESPQFVIYPDKLEKGRGEPTRKSEPRGGNYYRRIPTKKGGFRYIYNPDSYHGREDAHLHGPEVKAERLRKTVVSRIQKAGLSGTELRHFEDLGDPAEVEQSLTAAIESGDVIYKDGRYFVGRKEQTT